MSTTSRRQSLSVVESLFEEAAANEKLQQEITAEKKKAYNDSRDRGNPEKPENVKDPVGIASVVGMIISMLTTALILMLK